MLTEYKLVNLLSMDIKQFIISWQPTMHAYCSYPAGLSQTDVPSSRGNGLIGAPQPPLSVPGNWDELHGGGAHREGSRLATQTAGLLEVATVCLGAADSLF